MNGDFQRDTFFHQIFYESIDCKRRFLADCHAQMIHIANLMTTQLTQNKKILLFGNGGSAADAQHLAAEFVNRLTRHRPAIPAIALTTDSSVITSIANDYDFDQIFARQIEALGEESDIALGISTSGNSPNIIKAIETAHRRRLITIGFLGGDGGLLKTMMDYTLIVPSKSPQRIQETHITIGHALCEWVERSMYSQPPQSHGSR